ncbi:hypothetical protein [Acidiphilium sp.]|uniref:hypothetical protein n=1 Tax=Acidiphilium sp. TaxID=527 RepID=UPI00258760AC|nr:hypothetical protein [Acidiphilium sp.]
MTDARRNTTARPRRGTPRAPISAVEVARLIDGLAPHLSGEMRPRPDFLPPGPRKIHARLRVDPGGQVSAALNRLPHHHPAIVLAETVRAAMAALDQLRIEEKAQEAIAREDDWARRLREIASEIEATFPPGGIILEARDLRRVADTHADRAARLAKALTESGFSRKKAAPRAAIIGAAARLLADALWGNGKRDLEVLRLLLGAAVDGEVLPGEVRAALRSRVRTRRHSEE